MKRIMLLTGFLLWFISWPVHALSWAYPFVVWDGKVYEVKREETIPDTEIGQMIGEVKTKPDDMTGRFFGNASNNYPKGTAYYEIKAIPVSSAIAVQEGKQRVKAVYVHEAPFHIMNVLTSLYFAAGMVITAAIITYIILRNRPAKRTS